MVQSYQVIYEKQKEKQTYIDSKYNQIQPKAKYWLDSKTDTATK